MNIFSQTKRFLNDIFRRGIYMTNGEKLTDINSHPKININPEDLERINRNLREYRNEYPPVKYTNVYGHKTEREFNAINIRKTVSKMLSDLIFNEDIEVVINGDENDNEKYNAGLFINNVFDNNDFKRVLAQRMESMFALGGLTVRPYYDPYKRDIKFSWAMANEFYPLKHNTTAISEGVMITTDVDYSSKKTLYYTLLEFHEWREDAYIITNELYKSDKKTEIGERVPLSSYSKYEDVEEVTVYDNFTRPLFNYCKPAGFNNINHHSLLGLGIIDNAHKIVNVINETYDEYRWDVRSSQKTIFVDDSMLNITGGENGISGPPIFDPDTNVYRAMPFGPDTKEHVKDITLPMRPEEYIKVLNYNFRVLESQLSLSEGSLSFSESKGLRTATEIISENDATYRTRNTNVYEIRKFIQGVIISTLELASSEGLFLGDIPEQNDIAVRFDDGIFQTKDDLREHYSQLLNSGLISRAYAIQKILNVPKETAEEMLSEINEEENREAYNSMLQLGADDSLFGGSE